MVASPTDSNRKKKKKRGHQDKINLIHIHLGAKIQHLTSKKKGKTKG
jgi:arginine decarboxylase-like protein